MPGPEPENEEVTKKKRELFEMLPDMLEQTTRQVSTLPLALMILTHEREELKENQPETYYRIKGLLRAYLKAMLEAPEAVSKMITEMK